MLVGGIIRNPKVQQLIQEFLNGTVNQSDGTVDRRNGLLQKAERQLVEATKEQMRAKNKYDKRNVKVSLIGGITRIPKVQQLIQEFLNGKKLCRSRSTSAGRPLPRAISLRASL